MKKSIFSWWKKDKKKKPKKLFDINKSIYDLWQTHQKVDKPLTFAKLLAVVKKARQIKHADDIYLPVHPDSILGKEILKREKTKKS